MFTLSESFYIADDLVFIALESEYSVEDEEAEMDEGNNDSDVTNVSDQEVSDDDSGNIDNSDVSDTTEDVVLSDIYEVMVVQSYLSVVIAFGVFLACGALLAKILWERLK